MSRTRWLMTASAAFLGALGLLGTFAPELLLERAGAPAAPVLVLMTQALGALYLGFAYLNWMARFNLIGGVYSRPVAMGNFLHLMVAGIAIVRAVLDDPGLRALWPLALLYAMFAAAFGLVVFRHPIAPRAREPA